VNVTIWMQSHWHGIFYIACHLWWIVISFGKRFALHVRHLNGSKQHAVVTLLMSYNVPDPVYYVETVAFSFWLCLHGIVGGIEYESRCYTESAMLSFHFAGAESVNCSFVVADEMFVARRQRWLYRSTAECRRCRAIWPETTWVVVADRLPANGRRSAVIKLLLLSARCPVCLVPYIIPAPLSSPSIVLVNRWSSPLKFSWFFYSPSKNCCLLYCESLQL